MPKDIKILFFLLLYTAFCSVKIVAQVSEKDITTKTNQIQHGADSSFLKAQATINALPNKWLAKLKNKYSGINKNMEKDNAKMLKSMNKQELSIHKKLATKDSVAAKAEYENFQKKYARIKRLMADTGFGKTKNISSLNTYIPGMDSLQTAMKFSEEIGGRRQEIGEIQNKFKQVGGIQQNTGYQLPGNTSLPSTPNLNTITGNQQLPTSNISADKLANIGGINSEMQGIQKQMQISQELNKLAEDRKQQLKGLLGKYNMEDQLMPYKKQTYYYKQQMNDYKTTLEDKDKIQEKVIGWAKNQDGFKGFMAKNSFLAKLFPGSGTTGSGTAAALTGLQTRAGVQQQLMQQMGGAANLPSAQGYINQQMGAAQGELSQLKDKLNQQGSNSSTADMPDFKPNSQKTKSFLKRIEYGCNIQSQRPNGLLPVTSDIAATAGYKFTDKLVAGLGLSYKLGWGKDYKHIEFTSQGIGFRSYIDFKLKKTFWLTGGWEQNYFPQLQSTISSMPANTHYSSWGNGWQESGLVGLTKKYKVNKKECKMQLLWDFLSYSDVPGTPRILYRVGYTL